ncbi:hypothetical protein HPB49_024061 [Dermacentor silvarum]|uniref:Uncharacterized protein n=1 Tax=Dermacentor silvarum TaxID=543639 RepID=A0ACB8CIB5_DERSI|nr:hypothetical protein HPB49_024061 [Dermacentor silvarum]
MPTLDPEFKEARGIATLIRKEVSFVERGAPTYKKGLESMLKEIVPSRALKTNIYILNVYTFSIDRLGNFNKLLTSAASQAKDRPLIVAGDFNAHNTVWCGAQERGERKGLTLPIARTPSASNSSRTQGFRRADVTRFRGTPDIGTQPDIGIEAPTRSPCWTPMARSSTQSR